MLKRQQLKNRGMLCLVMRLINVTTQSTPNPNFIKFLPENRTLMNNYDTMDFTNYDKSKVSPLAVDLFRINGINRVFYGNNYISVSKTEDQSWEVLKPLISSTISQFYDQDIPLFNESLVQEQNEQQDENEAVEAIREILDSRIRPVVQEDGGDIKYVSFDEQKGIVYLSMQGSCSGCPSSGDTLKNGIERMLQYYVAEVNSVQAVDYEG